MKNNLKKYITNKNHEEENTWGKSKDNIYTNENLARKGELNTWAWFANDNGTTLDTTTWHQNGYDNSRQRKLKQFLMSSR